MKISHDAQQQIHQQLLEERKFREEVKSLLQQGKSLWEKIGWIFEAALTFTLLALVLAIAVALARL